MVRSEKELKLNGDGPPREQRAKKPLTWKWVFLRLPCSIDAIDKWSLMERSIMRLQ